MNMNGNALDLEVEYTTAKPVEGLSGLGVDPSPYITPSTRPPDRNSRREWIWGVKVPPSAPSGSSCPGIGGCRPRAPWSKVYLDDDVRIAKDTSGPLRLREARITNALPKNRVRNFQRLDGRADVVDADDVGVRDAGDAGAGRRRVSLSKRRPRPRGRRGTVF